ncbi:MAG: CDP-glucose 4,6-dehydratase [Oscillospiraceae bacterium]|jgi:CDP-glucose 4,6-dehydratase|nr:CDP-glucose 4,6-dehydratase [Oscillospiraceae bacterium]
MIKSSFWNKKRIFVTGHTGFKGTWLCRILENLSADVTGYALAPQTTPNLFENCKPDINSVIGDIRDYNALSRAFKNANPEIVIHMAAQPLVFESYKEPRYTYETNVMGTVNILECVKKSSTVKSVLNVTTDKVYLNPGHTEGYREDEKLCGFDPYANSKSCSELVTYSYKKSFLDALGVAVSTARSGNVIGGGDFSENRLIPDCVRAVSKNETIKIRNKNSVRPYQHVLDTLFAYLLIVESQASGEYNIGPHESDCATSGELAAMFCNAWGENAGWEPISIDNPHEDNLLKLDCSKIERELDWKPSWDIGRAVEETVLWHKTYLNKGSIESVMSEQIGEFIRR